MRGRLLLLSMLAACGCGQAQGSRDAMLQDDEAAFAGRAGWIYDDLEAGLRRARQEKKPLLVALRCVP
jgi:hypothetical protein